MYVVVAERLISFSFFIKTQELDKENWNRDSVKSIATIRNDNMPKIFPEDLIQRK